MVERDIIMHTYTYQLPAVKGSKEHIHIFSEENQVIYTTYRKYKSILQEFIDAWIDEFRLYCEFEGIDSSGNVVATSHKKHYFSKRSKSVLTINKETYYAETVGIDAITPTYKIIGLDLQMKTTINEKRLVRFYENEEVVANIQLSFSNRRRCILEIEEVATIQHPLFYVISAQMFYFIGE